MLRLDWQSVVPDSVQGQRTAGPRPRPALHRVPRVAFGRPGPVPGDSPGQRAAVRTGTPRRRHLRSRQPCHFADSGGPVQQPAGLHRLFSQRLRPVADVPRQQGADAVPVAAEA